MSTRQSSKWTPALRFVLMVGAMSFFADLTYEGSRSIIGQYLGLPGADRTGRHWPIAIGFGLCAGYAPLAFLGGFWPILIGVCLWGLGMGVHESIIPAAVADTVPPDRRASAYGVFTGVYGIAFSVARNRNRRRRRPEHQP